MNVYDNVSALICAQGTVNMMSNDQPVVPANQRLPEITIRAVVLAIILAVVLAVSNTYLALKIGILTSASIPAAIISMGVLRFSSDLIF